NAQPPDARRSVEGPQSRRCDRHHLHAQPQDASCAGHFRQELKLRSMKSITPKRFAHAAFLLCAASGLAFAATEPDAETLNTALRIEAEMTSAVDKATSAFAFVGYGSGIVISPDGYILSNHHVAGERNQWTVRVYGMRKYYVCELVGTDPVGDLCLLK